MNLTNKKIIIVEDNYIIYMGLVRFFEKKNLVVIPNTLPHRAIDNYEDAVKLIDFHRPDIAILDIKLKGEKNGLDLCDYIKKRFDTFIIILSDSKDPGNLSRARTAFADSYVLKSDVPADDIIDIDDEQVFRMGKTHDKDQLWAAIQMRYPFREFQNKETGGEFNVCKIKPDEKKVIYQGEFGKQFIFWDKLLWIESCNAEAHNNVKLSFDLPRMEYISRTTLTEIMNHLPDYFIRANKYQIFNKRCITSQPGKWIYLIGNKEFKINLTYRSEAKRRLSAD